eukprot:scaffold129727_cov31-Tisochrysis_lutea.AAC.1
MPSAQPGWRSERQVESTASPALAAQVNPSFLSLEPSTLFPFPPVSPLPPSRVPHGCLGAAAGAPPTTQDQFFYRGKSCVIVAGGCSAAKARTRTGAAEVAPLQGPLALQTVSRAAGPAPLARSEGNPAAQEALLLNFAGRRGSGHLPFRHRTVRASRVGFRVALSGDELEVATHPHPTTNYQLQLSTIQLYGGHWSRSVEYGTYLKLSHQMSIVYSPFT